MPEKQAPLAFSGRWSYRLRGLFNLNRCLARVLVRRAFRGPLQPGWPFAVEVGTEFLRMQTIAAFHMTSTADAREYEDAVLLPSPAVLRVTIEPVASPIRGHWYTPKEDIGETVVLYLHGGAYTYYSKGHEGLIALAALACRAKTFALDYRLSPEHPYPAQLEDALAAYRWLLETGVSPGRIIVMGDSAGGNLTLALLLKLRELGLPRPAGGVPLCPWTDPANTVSPVEVMAKHDRYDWPQSQMVLKWCDWFRGNTPSNDPLFAPIHADLTGLPPLYIQAGGAEILFDQIERFMRKAQAQGADVAYDTWPTMPHDFQAFGDLAPESQEAWKRIAAFSAECVAANQQPASEGR